METQELKSIVEALIFAADEPLSEARLRETLELENGFDFGVLIEGLNQEYQSSGRVFTIRKIAGGYQIVTQQNYASWIKKLYLGRQKNRLSHAALETLALIAFKQPISRVDIGQIRGVNSDGVIGTLLERKLVTISGRSEAVGRPLLYSTTAEFLKYFGINDIADLPKPREIEELFSKEGMPEELLQALSQTDAQLSLPINGDGETPTTPDETENKITTAAASALPPVIIETPQTIKAPLETAEIESSEIVADSPAETAEIESSEIVADSPAETEKIESLETVADSPAEVEKIESPETVIDSPAETEKTESLETVADSPAEHIVDDADTTPVAAMPLLTPEIPAVDINEEVVTQLEEADKLEVALSSSAPTPVSENEIAWISLNSANGNAAEHFTGNELAIDDFTETANELPTFAGVAEVVAEHSVEQPATNELAIDDLTETANDLPPFAGVSEVVSETFAVEAGGAADSEIEVQVVEAYDVGRAEVESPPELQSNAAEEVDGWMAEDFSPEEIAEPDFIKKSRDFFLEDERHGLVATSDADASATVAESEPIVVSDAALTSLADEIFLSSEATENNFTTPEAPSSETPQPPEFLTLSIETGNIETAPEQSANVTVVDFPEPTIVEIIPDAAPSNSDDIAVSGILGETANSPTFESTLLSAPERAATAEQFESSIGVDFAESPIIDSVAAATPTLVDEMRASDETADSAAFEVIPVASTREELTATAQETSLLENNDGRSTTLRERVVGWIKRTFNKVMTFIGAAPESE